MRVWTQQGINRLHPGNYGYATLPAPRGRGRGGMGFVLAASLMLAVIVPPAKAQQASQPGFDPRQTEKRFDALQSQRTAAAARSALPIPGLARSMPTADSTPLVVLHKVSLTGARAVPPEEIARTYHPKPISPRSPRRSATSIA
jgi:hypothetical protein